MTPTREAVLAEAARLTRIGLPDAADLMRALLREIETTSAELERLTHRFAELAKERDELLLQLKR